uniref:Uncharacterized protein n=1 Tax=Timema poppense TaxID=170557 RepID=A0A7R9GW52_TIMPO|nr:unnamed protein product [Timema poppensis]
MKKKTIQKENDGDEVCRLNNFYSSITKSAYAPLRYMLSPSESLEFHQLALLVTDDHISGQQLTRASVEPTIQACAVEEDILVEMYLHLSEGSVWNNLNRAIFSTSNRDSNPNPPITGSPVEHDSDALDRATQYTDTSFRTRLLEKPLNLFLQNQADEEFDYHALVLG